MTGRDLLWRAGLVALLASGVSRVAVAGPWHYVSHSGSNTPPYDSWGSAATNIQLAVDVAADGDEIDINSAGGQPYTHTGEVRVTRRIFINGLDSFVDGQGLHRGLWVGTNARVARLTVTNCYSAEAGGAIYCDSGTISNCTVRRSRSSAGGGGIFVTGSGIVARCEVTDNLTTNASAGGGIKAELHSVVDGCVIRGNWANNNGGGLAVISWATARNCLVVSNASTGGGGGVYLFPPVYAPVLESSTICGNSGLSGGGVYCDSSNATIRNCIIYANTGGIASNHAASGGGSIWWNNNTAPSIGSNCVTADPGLTGKLGAPWHLDTNSPCINAGTNQSWMAAASDLDGKPRVLNHTVDLGAHELSVACVSPSGSHTAPFDTWAKAATNLHDPVSLALDGYTILITNGTIGMTGQCSLITRRVHIRSVNGPSATILDARGTDRHFWIQTASILEGLTLTNGFGDESGSVSMIGGSVMENCVLSGNRAGSFGALGIGNATARHSVFTGNVSSNGAAVGMGPGALVDECVIRSNSAVTLAGGVYLQGGEIRNTWIANNFGRQGGGVYATAGAVEASVISDNASSNGGGGVYFNGGGTLRNTMVYFNTDVSGQPNYGGAGGSWTNCCTTPAAGVACVTNNPLPVDRAAGNFRLSPSSPCIDAGTNQPWMADGTDYDGRPRIVNGRVDIGMFERTPTHYVSPLGSHAWPFITWSNAATNVQAAVDAAESDDSVLVTNGVFVSASSISVTQRLSVASVNGAAVTAIDGGSTCQGFIVTTNALIDGFTVTNCVSGGNAGGVYGAGGAIFQNCVIRNCMAINYGGGAFLSRTAVVQRCVIQLNTAQINDGGGLYLEMGGAAIDCTIVSNNSVQAGGAYAYNGGTLRNCLVAGNRARTSNGGGVLMYQPGGLVENCTIAGNASAGSGGGVYCNSGGTLSNSIVYGNTGSGGGSNWAGGTWSYSCAAPMPGGTGNTGGNPRFAGATAGNFRVSSNSPCYNSGTNAAWAAGAADLDGVSRVINGSVDMGCYEVTPVHCVARSGLPAWPYGAWTNAATNLQTAINAAQPDDTILVSNGTYVVGSFVWASQRVAIASVNGRDVTAIDAGGATRCVYMPNGGVLDGLTFTNAYSPSDGGGIFAGAGVVIQSCRVVNCSAAWSGGGIYLDASGVVQNCDIRQNRAGHMGGGVMLYLGGLLQNCTVFSNVSAGAGGGVFNGNGGNVRNCLIEANAATNANGGGVYIDTSGWVENATLVRNTAPAGQGGGAYCLGGGTIRNSIIVSNAAPANANWATNGGGQITFTCTAPLPPGAGNTSEDATFIDFAAANYLPFFDSPCRDTATNLPWMAGGTDLAGVPRVCAFGPDMGAYELPVRLVSRTGSHTAPYLTWATAATNLQTALDLAGRGGAVLVTNGSYAFNAEAVVSQTMSVASMGGAGATVLSGGGAHRIFRVVTNAEVDGFRCSGGYASGDGGGVHASGGARIRDCVFDACAASGNGGALCLVRTGVVERCAIYRSASPFFGGGAYVDGGGMLLNAIVQSNTARDGGGVYLLTGGVVRTSLILQNTSSNTAGGARLELGSPRMENCTIAGNSSANFGGGAVISSGGQIVNSIVYGNASASDSNVLLSGSGGLTNCCTAPPLGAACVAAAPGWVDAARGMFAPAWDSPCVDAGTNAAWMTDAQDLAGDTRLFGARVDIGAYELHRMYVAAAGGNTFPYDTWAKAATDIQSALNAASNYYEVRVTNGTYAPAAEIAVAAETVLRSANGAGLTIIDAGGTHRGVYVGPYATLDGFTVSNGNGAVFGAGVYGDVGSRVRNCVIAGNRSTTNGGGIYLAPSSVVEYCTIVGNSNTAIGGGACLTRTSLLLSSVVRSNAAKVAGGGVCCDGGGIVRNCLVGDNWSSPVDGAGGGIYLLSGLPGCMVENCTVFSNSSWSAGGVFVNGGGEVWSSIVYGNNGSFGTNYWDVGAGRWSNNCTVPAIGGNAVTNAPQYMNAAAGNFRLSPDSPCVDAGAAESWMATGADLEGAARVAGARVDIGAYEFHYNCVSLSGGHVSPYDSWANAATDLQSAVNIATNGYSVLVTNGVYTPAAEISVSRPIRIASVNGAEVTAVNGAGARRAFNVTTGAVISGFTLTNGYSSSLGGGAYLDGGALLQSSKVVNCVGNSFAGGLYVTRNSVAQDCTIRRCRANVNHGGGVYVAEGGRVDRCVIDHNQAPLAGGLCDQGGTTRNCLIINNLANSGGGVYLRSGGAAGTVESSTICSNSASDSGGVFFDGVGLLRNCIVYYNNSSNYGGSGGTMLFCNTTPSNGAGCVTADPALAGGGDYHPTFASPCLGAGTNLAWMSGALDLDLGPRLVGATVDIGAYELGAIHYVKLLGSPVSPFTTWANAATNIQAAVNVCAEGDMVLITNGSYSAAAEIVVTQRITILSVNGSAATAVDGARAHRGFNIRTNAIVDGLAVTNGYSADVGGGILLAGGGLVRNCSIRTNVAATYGGGVFVQVTGVVQNCSVIGNVAAANDGGGVYLEPGGVVLDSVIVSNNARHGGGVYSYNGGLIRNSLLAYNVGRSWGGGVHFYQPGGVADSCTIVENAAAYGGGAYTVQGGSLQNCIIYFNAATSGGSNNYDNSGGQWASCCTAPATGTDCVAADPQFANRAAGNFRLSWGSPCVDAGLTEDWMGGGRDLDGDLRIWNGEADIGAYEFPILHVATDGDSVTPYATWADAATNPVAAAAVARGHCAIRVADGTYPIAAQISLTGSVSFVSVNGAGSTTIRGNGATRCFDIGYGRCVIDGFTITAGVTNNGGGGGVRITRGGTVRNSVIVSNYANYGGGIFCFASGVVENCSIRDNVCDLGGGGIQFLAGGTACNCLIYSNRADGGGGIFASYGPSNYIRNCTIVRNTATTEGGGIELSSSGGQVESSIIYFNTAASGSNHYESDAGSTYTNCNTLPVAGANGVSNNPMFVNLAGLNLHLATNSPCIDAGVNSSAVTNDFDGQPRPLDGDRDGAAIADIGAYEVLNPYADSNTNGMPDGWENQHYGSPVSGADPALDEDGDAVANSNEAIADTSPHDGSSFLAVTNIFDDEDWRTVQFLSSSNRIYTQQCSTNPVDPSSWKPGSYVDQRGNGGTRSWKETNTPFVVERVLVEIPP